MAAAGMESMSMASWMEFLATVAHVGIPFPVGVEASCQGLGVSVESLSSMPLLSKARR